MSSFPLTTKDLKGHSGFRIRTSNNRFIDSKDIGIIRYFTEKDVPNLAVIYPQYNLGNGIYAFTTNNEAILLPGTQGRIKKLFKQLEGPWMLLSTKHIVNTDNIADFSGTGNDYYLQMKGQEEYFHIGSKTSVKKLKSKYDITRLDYLTPCPTNLKILRELGVYDLGVKELEALDANDPKAVKAFKEEWDLTRWPYDKLYKHFKYKTVPGLDMSKLMTNIIWQKYKWIKKGIDAKHEGSIRTLWYTVEAAIDHHPDVTDDISSDAYGAALGALVASKIFTYKDIGFIDVRQQYRGVGKKNPAVILISEKAGHFFRVRGMAKPYGMTFACTKGQPSHLMMEYFTEELRAAGIDFKNDPVHIFTISDYDSAGDSIRNNMIKFLREQAGIEKLVTYNLIDLKRFDDEMVSFARTKSIRFYKDENGNPCPLDDYKEEVTNEKLDVETLEPLVVDNDAKDLNTRNAKFTRIYNWWSSLGDQKERLITKDYINGKWIYTIWKVSADAIDWYQVEEHYHKVVEEIIEGRKCLNK